jgi:hypothetical protein
MHVVGARFADLESALAALGEIRARVPVGPGEVGVRALGSTHYEEPAWGFILAGRFAPAVVDAVVAIMEGRGGRVLTHYVERAHPSLTRVTGTAAGKAMGPGRDPRSRADEHALSTFLRRPRPEGLKRPARKRLRRPAALLRSRAARIGEREPDEDQ